MKGVDCGPGGNLTGRPSRTATLTAGLARTANPKRVASGHYGSARAHGRNRYSLGRELVLTGSVAGAISGRSRWRGAVTPGWGKTMKIHALCLSASALTLAFGGFAACTDHTAGVRNFPEFDDAARIGGHRRAAHRVPAKDGHRRHRPHRHGPHQEERHHRRPAAVPQPVADGQQLRPGQRRRHPRHRQGRAQQPDRHRRRHLPRRRADLPRLLPGGALL